MLRKVLALLFPPTIFDCSLLPLNIKQEVFSDDSLLVTFFDYKNEQVKNLIITLKENESLELLMSLAKIIQPKFEEILNNYHFTNIRHTDRNGNMKIYFVPVPARKQRLEEFGFNQTELFSKSLSKLISNSKTIPLVYRIKEIEKQSHKNKLQRVQEINHTMKYKEKIPEDISRNSLFIIVDDVVTTGSTLWEVLRVLQLAGARQVLVLALARA